MDETHFIASSPAADRVQEVTHLRSHLVALAKRADAQWEDSLCERKKEEMSHSDFCRTNQAAKSTDGTSSEAEFGNRKWYSAARQSKQYVRSWIQTHARGSIFLDYACGSGGYTILAAEAGAALAVGIDLSSVGLAVGRRVAAEKNVSQNSFFLQTDCEATGLPDSSVDVILCSGMLHHLDLEVAMPEMYRILKPGGKCLAVEAFKYNPFIWLYRRLTPRYRTRWEENHILGLKEIRLIRRFLEVGNRRHWHFFSLGAVPFRRTPLFGPLMACGELLDQIALRVYPLSLLSWQVTFEMTKPAEVTDTPHRATRQAELDAASDQHAGRRRAPSRSANAGLAASRVDR